MANWMAYDFVKKIGDLSKTIFVWFTNELYTWTFYLSPMLKRSENLYQGDKFYLSSLLKRGENLY